MTYDRTPTHGTDGGYFRHIRGTTTAGPSEPCGPCRAGHAEAERVRSVSRQKPIAHGTDRGYSQHRRRKSPPCDDCRAAHTAAHRPATAKPRRRPAPRTIAPEVPLRWVPNGRGILIAEWAS